MSEHAYLKGETVYRDGVAGKVIRRLWLRNTDTNEITAAYEVQFTDGRRLILEEAEVSAE